MQNRRNIVNPKVFPEHMCTNQNLCKQRDKQFQIYLTRLSDHQLSSLLQTDPYLLWSAPDQPDVNQLLLSCCTSVSITAANCKDYLPTYSALLVLLHRFCIAACCYPGVLGLPLQSGWPCPLSWCAPTPQSTLGPLLHCYKTSYRRSATENKQFFIFILFYFSK